MRENSTDLGDKLILKMFRTYLKKTIRFFIKDLKEYLKETERYEYLRREHLIMIIRSSLP